jgi:HEAT repeat protein
VRVEAAIALNHIKAEETVAPLMKALKEDDTPDVRRTIAIALGNFKSEEPVTALAEAARKDEAWQVRKAAVQSLGNIRSAACVPPVMEALVDAHEEVRAAAATVYPRLIALVGGQLAD